MSGVVVGDGVPRMLFWRLRGEWSGGVFFGGNTVRINAAGFLAKQIKKRFRVSGLGNFPALFVFKGEFVRLRRAVDEVFRLFFIFLPEKL